MIVKRMKLPIIAAVSVVQLLTVAVSHSAPIRVLVWDEQQPAQKQAYTNFLGNEIAGHLRRSADFEVKSTALDDPQQGLSGLDNFDIVIWWGHQRQDEITPKTAREIVQRVKDGKLALLMLHSAHWSQPFVEAMRERARADALAALVPAERATAVFVETNLFANFRTAPAYTTLRTPSVIYRKPPDQAVEIRLTLPNCCFPAYRPDGQPSHVRILLPDHPIARGVPLEFAIPQTEMYDEPFHVPEPDAVVFEERWKTGEWFRSGAVWNLGRGKIVYFRPGHELYPVFKNEHVLRIIENAVRWFGTEKGNGSSR